MKNFLAASMLLNLAFMVGTWMSWKDLTAHAAGRGGGFPIGNGDVNGDGTIDISDAVYTLSWLFTGGPAPVAIECPVAGRSGLPATGQTKCHDFTTGLVPCGDARCRGQDAEYAMGCPLEGRFIDNQNGTVTDTCTGLIWQKDTADLNADSQIDEADQATWCEALAYCEDLSFAGRDDWRLPNVRELESLVDYSSSYPSMDPMFGVFSERVVISSLWSYWASTYPERTVDFDEGYVSYAFDDGDHPPRRLVRAVRNAP